MKEIIFGSNFSLRYLNPEIEKEYQTKKENLLRFYGKYFTIILLLGSIEASITNSFFLNNFTVNLYKVMLLTSYISTFICFILFFFSCFCKNITLLKYVQYVNYLLFMFVCVNSRYSIVHF